MVKWRMRIWEKSWRKEERFWEMEDEYECGGIRGGEVGRMEGEDERGRRRAVWEGRVRERRIWEKSRKKKGRGWKEEGGI